MKKSGVVRLVNAKIKEAGSQSQAARMLGVPRQYLNDAIGQKAFISPALLTALGLERVWTYRRVPPASASTPNTKPAPVAATSSARR